MVGSLRLRMPRGRKGDMVVRGYGGRGVEKKGGKVMSVLLFPCVALWGVEGREIEGAFIGCDNGVWCEGRSGWQEY